jgi:hypothetical protein
MSHTCQGQGLVVLVLEDARQDVAAAMAYYTRVIKSLPLHVHLTHADFKGVATALAK